MKINFKIFNLSLLCALLFCFFISLGSFDASCEELRENVLRLHILANSNSEKDQSLKIAVRDAILKESADLFEETDNIDEAITKAQASLEGIENIAKNEIKSKGFDYSVDVKIDTAYFETRVYDEFTLPAGNYNSLVISIGKAEGKNWWCILFPELCLPSVTDRAELSKAVSSESESICKQSGRYEARFKIVEIYEMIKKSINY